MTLTLEETLSHTADIRRALHNGQDVFSVYDFITTTRQKQYREYARITFNLLNKHRPLYLHDVDASVVMLRFPGRWQRDTPCLNRAGLHALHKALDALRIWGRCPHGRRGQSRCIECHGSGICEHLRCRRECPVCDPVSHTTSRIRTSVYHAIKRGRAVKNQRTLQYLGISSFGEMIEHLRQKMDTYNAQTSGVKMTFTNTELDHIKPLAEFNRQGVSNDGPELLVRELHHYTNIQPLLREQNIRKSDAWSDKDEIFWKNNIIYNQQFKDIYMPTSVGPCNPAIDSSLCGGRAAGGACGGCRECSAHPTAPGAQTGPQAAGSASKSALAPPDDARVSVPPDLQIGS